MIILSLFHASMITDREMLNVLNLTMTAAKDTDWSLTIRLALLEKVLIRDSESIDVNARLY